MDLQRVAAGRLARRAAAGSPLDAAAALAAGGIPTYSASARRVSARVAKLPSIARPAEAASARPIVHHACPLCRSTSTAFFADQPPTKSLPTGRHFHRCETPSTTNGGGGDSTSSCGLIFVPSSFHVTASAARLRYDEHNNDPTAVGYLQHLRKLVDPLAKQMRLAGVGKEARGLDFGCGPTPTLAQVMHRQHGFQMESFDPIYFPQPKVHLVDHQRQHPPQSQPPASSSSSLSSSLVPPRRYAFLTANEVVEHFADPRGEFDRLIDERLESDGFLAIQTKSPDPDMVEWQLRTAGDSAAASVTAASSAGASGSLQSVSQLPVSSGSSSPSPGRRSLFVNWRYARDQTHVAFFSDATFAWLERRFGFRRLHRTADVWIGRRHDQ